jgi:hypothetical protein
MRSRTHLSLEKGPLRRPVMPPTAGRVVAIPEVSGLHYRYNRAAAESRRRSLAFRTSLLEIEPKLPELERFSPELTIREVGPSFSVGTPSRRSVHRYSEVD